MSVKILKGMESAAYHAIQGASASRIKAILRSPAHLRYSMENDSPSSDALVFGEAVHTAILEPQKFKDGYAMAPDVDRRTKDGRAAWQMFIDANPDKKVMTEDQYLAITGIAKSIGMHQMAHELISTRTETEVSLLWSQLGIDCKARIDAYSLEHRAVIDLKTTTDASPEEFARSVAKFKYHVQAAWYIDAMRAAGFDVETMIFIAVEKTGPYGVACYELDDAAVEEGRIQIAKALPILSNCMLTNDWPGYDHGVQTLALPRWAVRGEEATL